MSGVGKHHCVYRMFDAQDHLLYVGMSSNFPERLRAHVSKDWWHEVARVGVQHFDSADEAKFAEVKAIGNEDPRHNAFALWRKVVEESREAA